uniref:carbonic anhydrase n=1 Tax=Gryllodes sigillatus TaxID=13551 RepID=A0A0P0ALJ4_9ORTH|nr:spermatophylax protein 9 [Gryllodes sigillatus]
MNIWELLCFFTALYAAVVFAQEEDWKYENNGTAAWGDAYPACRGTQQSPIPLTRDGAKLWWPSMQRQAGFRIDLQNYGTAQQGVFVNDGKSVALIFNYTDISSAPHLIILNNGSVASYSLTRLHFHWPSEHWIYNQRYPLEMHMTHRDDNNNTLVLSILFTTECSVPSDGMQTVAAAVRRVKHSGDSVPIEDFAPVRLLPPFLQRDCGYYMFPGSLTTPPCSQDVLWLVHEVPLCIGRSQLEAFQNVERADGGLLASNARPLQAVNGRQVLYLPCQH